VETVRQKQSRFVKMVALLITYAHLAGYELTFGDAYRDPRCPYGHKQSLHRSRLAIDLNVFRDGVYLSGHGEYDDLGEYWEAIGGSWGGRFGDDNHFSLAHNGMV
jgi:hypothetical protein